MLPSSGKIWRRVSLFKTKRYHFTEQVDAVVFQERQEQELGGEPTSDHHLQHRRRLLGALQSYRTGVCVTKTFVIITIAPDK